MACSLNGITDIEDTITGAETVSVSRLKGNGIVGLGLKRFRRWTTKKGNDDQENGAVGDSFIPGSSSVYIKTWGCSHNNSDSEYMAGQLAAAGYKIKNTPNEADIWILNSCTVKTPAEQHVRNFIDEANKYAKPVVVTGCVPQAAPSTAWLKGLSLLGVQQIDRVVEVVEETLKGNSVRLLGSKKEGRRRLGGADLSLPKIRKNPLVEILAINTGCLNRCTYCKTKQARGDLASYTIEELVERARQSFTEGVKELWLTSEDLGAYGRDIGVTLPELLDELVKVIPDSCMIRLGMTNPPYILDYLEDIARVLNHPRVYSFLHIPVQSGSDAVLADMRREYTRNDFMKVVDYIRDNVPGVTIATDIICGFPTEDAEDFEETLSLVRKYQFPSLFINQYYPRPGTPAANLPRVNATEVKRRTKAAVELFNSYQPYSDRVGQEYDALVTEKAFDGDHYVGHNKAYEQILLPNVPDLIGKLVRTRVVSSSKYSMVGEIIDGSLEERKAQNRIRHYLSVLVPRQLNCSSAVFSRHNEVTLLVCILAVLLSVCKFFDVLSFL